jgi:predicted small lipoprotein YifL
MNNMKKLLALVLTLALVMSLAACGKKDEDKKDNSNETTPAVEKTDFTKSEGVMTYAQYDAVNVDEPVTVETFVQDKQSWWDNKATIYTQDNEGAYFIYEMQCSEEDYAKLVKGQKIRVKGFKADFQGEKEIADATFEILDGNYIAAATDVTSLLGTDELVKYQNRYVEFKGMTIAASKDADGNDAAFLYKWNGSGQDGDDLYFNVELNGNVYTFTVESYLCGKDTDVYKAVKELKVGDKVDLTGYLYWYDTVNPHIISVTEAK